MKFFMSTLIFKNIHFIGEFSFERRLWICKITPQTNQNQLKILDSYMDSLLMEMLGTEIVISEYKHEIVFLIIF